MRIQERKVDVKRHTVAYKVGGKWRSRGQAVEMAECGKIEGVTVCCGPYGKFIRSLPEQTNLYDRPIRLA